MKFRNELESLFLASFYILHFILVGSCLKCKH